MSHLTDKARAPFVNDDSTLNSNPTLAEIVAANPSRRTLLKNGLLGLSILPISALAACDDDDDSNIITTPNPTPTPSPTPTPTPTPVSFDVTFEAIDANVDDTVTVPAGYEVAVLLKAGDALEAGSTGYSGQFLTVAQAETVAGGNHDGMELFPLEGVDPNEGGLLAINFEFPDFAILFNGDYDAATATADQKALALSAVGIGVVEVAKSDNGWSVVADSQFNKRYTGNDTYRAGGPAAGNLSGTITGMLNNCSSGRTPWGTYLTCEETVNNYLDPTQPDEHYGWVVEIDPYQELTPPTKRTAMGRFSHENVAYSTDSDNRVAFYMGDDNRSGSVYKFVPDNAFNGSNRAANMGLLDYGTLYVAKFNGDGTGEWIALVQGMNGLDANAIDPGRQDRTTDTPTPTPFNTQADVLINTRAAARVVGGTDMDRPEWFTVAPDNSAIYVTLTNNSQRTVPNGPNPRVSNRHGQIVKMVESGESPLATTFTWELLLLAGDPSYTDANQQGNINGDTFTSPDGIRIDPQGRLWVQTDGGNEDVFGHNGMYYIDQETGESKRFLVGPNGCEITGLAYTPDLTTFFINIQHPEGNWPIAGEPPRSSTIVVTRTDASPVGA